MEKLAIFDVDYTLTKKETLVEFYKFILKKNPKLLLTLPYVLRSGVMYIFKFIELKKAKEGFMRFVENIHEEEMNKLVKAFYSEKLSKLIYEDAMAKIKELKEKGFKVYLISASAEFYLKELYNIKEVDKVIGTRYKVEDGYHSSCMIGENCKGEEKVRRLKEELKKENIEVDFQNSYMFSDSLSDLPLFNLVGNPYLINYKKNHPTIKILNWK